MQFDVLAVVAQGGDVVSGFAASCGQGHVRLSAPGSAAPPPGVRPISPASTSVPIARLRKLMRELVLLRDSTASLQRSMSGAALSSMERALVRRKARSQ
ncbi:hypothetical protein ACH41H_44990 [Streptomyces sp. NPDC020800]|uniref:hypothetical protein n=1 Tax=Streptomyces sp. NPDC020800 TaxID=3365092 RepID=UPI0037A4E081